MADWLKPGAFSVRAKKIASVATDAHSLKAEADRLFSSSLSSKDAPGTLALAMMRTAEADAGLFLPASIAAEVLETSLELLYASGLYMRDHDFSSIKISTPQGRIIQEELRTHIAVHQDEERYGVLIGTMIRGVFSHILGRLAINPLADASLYAGHIEREAPSLRLIDYIDDVPQMLDGIMDVMFAADTVSEPIFANLKEKLEADITHASGLVGEQITHAGQFIRPPDAKWDDPVELTERYLGAMPLRDLLLSNLPVEMPDAARFEHTHILGGTGHGKTQLMSQLILRDIEKAKEDKRSIIVMDSQGDLIRQILSLATLQGSHLASKIVIIDPTEFERPIALNPFTLDEKRLATYTAADRERTVHSAVSLFEFFFGELLGADLTAQQGTVFKFLIRLLVEIPDATLLTLRDILENPEPFRPHMMKLEGSARAFFEREFLNGGYASTRKQIARRLWAILSNPVYERLFSSPVNRLDWFELMQGGHIILINTAKDFLKPEGSRLLGRFLTAQVGQGILERAAVPEHDRTPTMFYIDEAHDQIDQTIEMLLSQGRKYKLGITLAHQHLDQLTTSQRSNVLSNTSIKLVGGLNRKDAATLAGEMRSTPGALQAMRKGRGETEFAFTMRHMIDTATTLKVPLGVINRQNEVAPEVVEACLELNRQRYGRVWEPEVFTPTKVTPRAKPEEGAAEKTSSERVERESEQTRTLPGRGSPAHKAEQERIRVLGAELGYLSKVEDTLRDGLGAVDVSLENDKARIAVEISITTPPEHEVANIIKCLHAGFDYVVATAPGRARLRAIEHCAWREITAADSPKILFLLPEDIEGFLHTHRAEPDENTIMGYKVIVKKVPKSSEDIRRRRERLEWLSGQLGKPSKPTI